MAMMGAGDDTFLWNPGDGSDMVDGQTGNDRLIFNGANIAEHFDVSANGSRARLVRDVGNVTMDMNNIENLDVHALGGSDAIHVGDLSGTGLSRVNLDLAAQAGGATGDGQADTVTVDGTNGNDVVNVSSGPSTRRRRPPGLRLHRRGRGRERLADRERPGRQRPDQRLGASRPRSIQLTIDGGAGNDSITGSAGNDLLIGGDGNDFIVGGPGSDTALLGAGDDTFTWNPGDGSDVVEGQAGNDRLVFNGSNADENFDVSANGSRVRLVRDVGNVTMDLNGVEALDVNALGGADTMTVNDLTGTDLAAVNLNLNATGQAGDGQADSVIVNGTAGADQILVAGDRDHDRDHGPAGGREDRRQRAGQRQPDHQRPGGRRHDRREGPCRRASPT